MNTLLLHPTDVLFFRDGRPMGGSLGGHGAAWPLPTVTNAALHAALHRADLEKAFGAKLHGHDHHRKSGERVVGARKFGSLVSAGPFPVIKNKEGKPTWLFPRPLDTGVTQGSELDSTAVTFQPLSKGLEDTYSSLPQPLKFPVAATLPPTKATPSPWWTPLAWETYLAGRELVAEKQVKKSGQNHEGEDQPVHFQKDGTFADTEFTYGIGMNAETGTQDGERFYSAHYLRLKPDTQLGLLAEAWDKINGDPNNTRDLISCLFPNSGTQTPVIVGGQQRLCTVEAKHKAPVPLPKGKSAGFEATDIEGNTVWPVKWVLLTPAIYPEISAGISKRGSERKSHPGGWLPTWICPKTGDVLLQTMSPDERKRRRNLNYGGRGYDSHPDIPATLVAAMVGKPITVTGYALLHKEAETQGGAKPTHLAVPAGSIYYFTCKSEADAQRLAAALNWHDEADPSTIRNRRSTLFGEKGFGLGVCGTWSFHSGDIPGSLKA